MSLRLAACAAPAMLWLASLPLGSALAHDSDPYGWISNEMLRDPQSQDWCCGALDCKTETVREVAGGYQVETGEIVPYARVIWRSPDGAWIRCRYLGGKRANQTRCLIGPPPGS
jgi:hypothetical protein